MLTCKVWAQIGAEFMYRSILIGDAKRLRTLCKTLDTHSQLGRWTKAVYIPRSLVYFGGDAFPLNTEDCLVSLIRHFPNLHIFSAESHLDASFPVIADCLQTFCRGLQSLHWQIPYEAQPKIVLALQGLQHLVSLHIILSKPAVEDADQERTLHGTGSLFELSFPCLKELALSGSIQDFAEQFTTWDMPKLTSLALDFGTELCDFPDVTELLIAHGPQLKMLDIQSLPDMDVPGLLAICRDLTTLCFSLDWRLEGGLVQAPHENIERIGLHGVRHAFGVGYAGAIAQSNPAQSMIMRRRNDMNFAALTTVAFPKLRIVRVLDPGLLRDLNRENGPARGPCFDRWNKWWEHCTAQWIRLEDCTGNLLGTLPQSDVDDSSEISEDNEDDRTESALDFYDPDLVQSV